MEKDTPCKWKQKAGIAILRTDKIDFKTKTTINKKGCYVVKKFSPTRRHNIYKYICTKYRGTKICKVNIRHKGRNWQ